MAPAVCETDHGAGVLQGTIVNIEEVEYVEPLTLKSDATKTARGRFERPGFGVDSVRFQFNVNVLFTYNLLIRKRMDKPETSPLREVPCGVSRDCTPDSLGVEVSFLADRWDNCAARNVPRSRRSDGAERR
eukprot:SAG31_NODE_12886_length_909_cov_0.829630_1_plen_131_part_00